VHIGTSGFSYPEWKPAFYPQGLAQKRFLAHYASRLSAVEIDATFYRLPKPVTLEAWREATGETFRFALKAPQRITHRERLAVPSSTLEYWTGLLPRLGHRLGVVLYQLPPFLPRDEQRLKAFLQALPSGVPVAFEFRHPSWFVPEIYALLSEHDAALTIHDSDQTTTPAELTARTAYLRLRRTRYDVSARRAWQERICGWAEQGVEVFAFIKHEDNPQAPWVAIEFATEFGHLQSRKTECQALASPPKEYVHDGTGHGS
jgi:uncharacterized protein YecE (DUF72 family)